MFLFQFSEGQTPKPVSRFGNLPAASQNQTEFFIYGGAGISAAGSTLELKPTLVRKGIRASAGVRKGYEAGGWAPVFELATFGKYGTLGTEPGVLSAGTHHGVSAFYGAQTDNQVVFESSGGPLGNILAAARAQQHMSAGEPFFSMPFTRAFAALKAAADFGYSAVKRGIEAFWPSIIEGQEQPGAETLKNVRDGNAKGLGIAECLAVMRYEKGDIGDRRKAGALLEDMLLSDLGKLASGGDAKLGLSDYDRLLPILEKSRCAEGEGGRPTHLISSSGWAAIRYGVDVLRMGLGSEETFKFVKNMAGAGGLASLLGGTMANFLSVDEYSVGKPLNLRWHGWNIPMTIFDTVGGWFEGIFDFKRTGEESGILKALGFLEDVGSMLLSPIARAIGSVLPVYRRSEGRAAEAVENAKKALEGCEELAAKTILAPAEMVRLNSDAAYLNAMLPVLRKAGEDKLADRIAKHFSEPKNELLHELVSCEMTRREAASLKADLDGEWVKDSGTLEMMEASLAQKRRELVQAYSYLRLKASEIKAKQMEAQPKGEKYFASKEEAALLKSVNDEIAAIENDCRKGRHPKLLAQSRDFDRVLGSLQEGGQMGADWKVVSDLLKRGEPASTQEEADAVLRFSTLLSYSRAYETVGAEFAKWAAAQEQGELEELFVQVEERCINAMDELDKDADELETAKEYEEYANSVGRAISAMGDLGVFGQVFGISSKKVQGWIADEVPSAMETLYGVKGKLDEEKGGGEESRKNAVARMGIEGAMVLLYSKFGPAALEELDAKQKDFVMGLASSGQYAQM